MPENKQDQRLISKDWMAKNVEILLKDYNWADHHRWNRR